MIAIETWYVKNFVIDVIYIYIYIYIMRIIMYAINIADKKHIKMFYE